MDVTRFRLLSILSVYLLGFPAWADIEYVTPEQTSRLESQFTAASFNLKRDAGALKEHKWSCDMFGARSHMQAQHGLKLYTLSEADGAWHNTGAQLVRDYKADGQALVGRKDRFEDQVKITKDGLLVSRLSLNDAAKTVIAYSVCKTL